MGIRLILLGSSLVYGFLYLLATAEPIEDRDALLDFIKNINYSGQLDWDRSVSACGGWTGVTCGNNGSRITGVRLANAGLNGVIPVNTLNRLTALEVLNLRLNNISGPFPSELLQLKNLVTLYLEFNNFQGPLPLDFPHWQNLVVLKLSNNGFNGSISPSISKLTRLNALDLANNSLSGDVPDINIPSLQQLDLSNNELTGAVPPSLLRFPPSAFLGNNMLSAPFSAHQHGPERHEFGTLALVGIAIGCFFVVGGLIALVLIYIKRKKMNNTSISTPSQKPTRMVSSVPDNCNSITFFEGCNLVFDLDDLLMASAEVLGKGDFGMTYRAVLEDMTMVVVKRLKEVIVGRKDFEQQMMTVGNIQHENVAPLRAYYYSKDEKLLIYDYCSHGSLSRLLHAKMGGHRIPLSWETRLNIAIGAARGIAYIHSQGEGKLIHGHGNIKASNIFLNSENCGCITDLGLATLASPLAPPALLSAGYCAPEMMGTRKVTQAADVYSFGIVLLEILTGKSPAHPVDGAEERLNLVRWVQAVVHEEWTGEVFDAELLRYAGIEEEMVAMLQVALSCVARTPEQRPKIKEVVKMLEDIRGSNAGNDSSFGTRTPSSPQSLTYHDSEIGSSFRF